MEKREKRPSAASIPYTETETDVAGRRAAEKESAPRRGEAKKRASPVEPRERESEYGAWGKTENALDGDEPSDSTRTEPSSAREREAGKGERAQGYRACLIHARARTERRSTGSQLERKREQNGDRAWSSLALTYNYIYSRNVCTYSD